MRNIEQIRAKNALSATTNTSYSGKDKGEVAKKVPTIIRENGIMGALAFALEKKGKNYANEGIKRVLDAVVKHLGDEEIGKVPSDVCDAESWLRYLTTKASSAELREQTEETMAYLGYFRRFANKE